MQERGRANLEDGGGVLMVRGVNRQVIEVTDTGSEEFERAILFVHPDSQKLAPDRLARQARHCLGGLRQGPVRARRRWPMLLGAVAVFLLGVLGGMLLVGLL